MLQLRLLQMLLKQIRPSYLSPRQSKSDLMPSKQQRKKEQKLFKDLLAHKLSIHQSFQFLISHSKNKIPLTAGIVSR